MKDQKQVNDTHNSERFNNLNSNDTKVSNKNDLGQINEHDPYQDYLNRADKVSEREAYQAYLNRPDKVWEKEAYEDYLNRPDKVWEREAYNTYLNSLEKKKDRELYKQYKKNKAKSSAGNVGSDKKPLQQVSEEKEANNNPLLNSSIQKEIATPDPIPGPTDDPSIVQMLTDPVVGAQIQEVKGSGIDLSIDLLKSLGFDGIADVKVHTDDTSILLCEVLNARAFAYGKDIFFNEGEFNPTSENGLKLLAHELNHIQQQGQTGNEKVERQVKSQTDGEVKAKKPGKRVGKALMMMLTRKANIQEMSLLKWQKVLGGSFNNGMMTLDDKVDDRFANKADKNAKAGVINTLNVNLRNNDTSNHKEANTGNVNAHIDQLPLQSINYIGEGFSFETSACLLQGIDFDVKLRKEKNDTNTKKDDPVSGDITLNTAYAGILDMAITLKDQDNLESKITIGKLEVEGLTIHLSNTYLGLYDEISPINLMFLIRDHLQNSLMFTWGGAMKLVDQLMGQASSETMNGMLENLATIDMSTMGSEVGFKSLSISQLNYSSEKDKSNYSLPDLQLGETAIKTNADPGNEKASEETLERKKKLRTLQSRYDTIKENEKAAHVKGKVKKEDKWKEERERLEREITSLKIQLMQDSEKQNFNLNIESKDVKLPSSQDNLGVILGAAGLPTEQVKGPSTVGIKNVRLNTAVGAEQYPNAAIKLKGITLDEIQLLGMKEFVTDSLWLKFDSGTLSNVVADAEVKYTTKSYSTGVESGYEMVHLSLNIGSIKTKGLRVITMGRELLFPEDKEITLEGLSLKLANNDWTSFGFTHIDLAGTSVTGLLQDTSKFNASGLSINKLDDGSIQFSLADADIHSTFKPSEDEDIMNGEANGEVDNLSVKGRYKDDTLYLDNLSVGSLTLNDFSYLSKDGQTYIKMPEAGSGTLTGILVSAEIAFDAGSGSVASVKIPSLKAGAFKAKGLKAHYGMSGGNMVDINMKPGEEGSIGPFYATNFNYNSRGLVKANGEHHKNKMSGMFGVAGLDMPGFKVLIKDAFEAEAGVSTGNIDFGVLNDGSSVLTVTNTDFKFSSLKGDAFDKSGLDVKGLLNNDSLNIGGIIIETDANKESKIFVSAIDVKNIKIENAGNTYEMDVFIPGMMSIEEVAKADFAGETAPAWLIDSNGSVEVTRFVMTSSDLALGDGKSEDDRRLEKAESNMDDLEAKEQKTVDEFLKTKRDSAWAYKKMDDEKAAKNKAEEEKQARLKEAEKYSGLFKMTENANGFIKVNIFGGTIELQVNRGLVSIEQLLTDLPELISNYIRQQPPEGMMDSELIDFAEDLDGWTSTIAEVGEGWKPINNLLETIKEGKGNEGLANFVTQYASRMQINPSANPVSIRVLDGIPMVLDPVDIPFVNQGNYYYGVGRGAVSLSGLMDFWNKKMSESPPVGDIESINEYKELLKKKKIESLNFHDMMKGVNEKEAKDFVFLSYQDVILPYAGIWLNHYIQNLIITEFQDLEILLNGLELKNAEEFLLKNNFGNLKFDDSNPLLDLHVSKANLEEFKIDSIVLPPFNYVNVEKNFKLISDKITSGDISGKREQQNGNVSTNLSIENIKVLIKKNGDNN